MLKKMRARFIGSAMAACCAVVLVLLCAINLWNWKLSTDRMDDSLRMLLEAGQREGRPEPFQLPGLFGGESREARYMMRYFTVRVGADGEMQVDHENIASVTAEEAKEYAAHILSSARTAGYYQGCRYLVAENGDGKTVSFLNAEWEMQAMKTLLLVSCIVALASLLAMFGLVVLFSKRAIAPYVRNLETQKRFITDAGHELKTPLTSISTSADLLAMEQAGNEWVRNIQSQSARMGKLVSNLVALSRLDEEQPLPERTDFSFSEAVWEISEPFSAQAAARGEHFSQEIEEGLVFRGDRNAIQQMVSILLDNAVRYSGEGGKIRLEVRKWHRKIRLETRNTCPPQDGLDLERLFDRFYRPDLARSANSGGTGIGLSIAKAAVEAHGGTISARAAGDGELVFTVLL